MPRTKKLHAAKYFNQTIDGDSSARSYCGLHEDSDVEWTLGSSSNSTTCMTCRRAMEAYRIKKLEKYLSNYPFGHDSL